ncbi:MAG TPA: DUF4440 domain-containing protein, partial [Flavitalea sp.]|nr:DUF4440 domain-containing protein [Flavitalea sp.]
SIRDLVKAETAFARLAVETNVRDAFLANMSEHSMLENNGQLIPGLPVYRELKPDSTFKLSWYPTTAAISLAGDLGYTTGPFDLKAGDGLTVVGTFATVWEKMPSGEWKLLIDLGTAHAAGPIRKKTKLKSILPEKAQVGSTDSDLLAADSTFAVMLAKDSPGAYRQVLHPSGVVLRDGSTPLGNGAGTDSLTIGIKFTPQGSRISGSGDLGVVYGRCVVNPEQPTAANGVYMHVWRRDNVRGWQMLHETIKHSR